MRSISSALSSVPGSERKANLLLLGHVRDIRTEAQNLHKTVCLLTKTLKDENIADAEMETGVKHELQVGRQIISAHEAQIREHFASIRSILERYPELYDRDGDMITSIQDNWDRMISGWSELSVEQPLHEKELLRQLDDIEKNLFELMVSAEKLTFPDRLNEKLEEMRIGQPLDFVAEFSDEFPAREYQLRALQYLREHSGLVMGVVDVEHGLIYRASSHFWRRLISPVFITGCAVVGALMVVLLHVLNVFPDVGLDNLLRDYVAIIIGGLAHTLVDALKQYRTRGEHTFIALGDLVMWAHIKEVPILISVLLLWVGFLGIAFSGQGKDWQAAFFVGYSIDSVIDLFLLRFTGEASKRLEAVRTQQPQQTSSPRH